MLVLTRKPEQKIQIGDSITITIIRIKGNAVRVGIEAPETVRIVRAELPPREVAADTFLYESAEERTPATLNAAAPSSAAPRRTPVLRRGLADRVSRRGQFAMPSAAPGGESATERNPSRPSPFLSRRSPVASSTPGFRSPERLGPAVLPRTVE